MTPSELKCALAAAGRNPHFFSRKTMAFFGDTMANFGCRSAIVTTKDGPVPAWELWRKRTVKHGLQTSHFFHKVTFDTVRPV